jgi:hypothetical protein
VFIVTPSVPIHIKSITWRYDSLTNKLVADTSYTLKSEPQIGAIVTDSYIQYSINGDIFLEIKKENSLTLYETMSKFLHIDAKNRAKEYEKLRFYEKYFGEIEGDLNDGECVRLCKPKYEIKYCEPKK